ncbi:MAG: Tripartite tricarboxylate transporter TctA family, partial [uncultured Thermomicrobiales bacterium]
GSPWRPPVRVRGCADAAEPLLGAGRGGARHRGRGPPGDRAGADRGPAAAADLPPRRDRRLHHVRRHLLRRHVRRLDDLDPAQHPRRVVVDRDRARGEPDGEAGARLGRPRHRRRRLLRRRHHRHGRADLPRPGDGRRRSPLRPRRVLRPDRAGLHHDHRPPRGVALAGAPQPVGWPRDRPGRDRHPLRPEPLHLRHPRAAERDRRRHRGGRPLRRRRDALGGLPDAPRRRYRDPDRGDGRDDALRVGPVVAAVAAGDSARLPDRQPAGRRRRDPDLPLLRPGEEADEAPGGVRPRRDRGGRRAGGRQQRRRRRRPDPPADARPADLGHRRDPPRRLPALRARPRADPLHPGPGARLGPDRQPLHRERDAAGAEPAAGRCLGPPAGNPPAAALRRDPRPGRARHLRPDGLGRRPGRPLRARRPRLRDAPLRRAGGPGRRRRHPRADRRAALPARPPDRPGRLRHLRHPPDLGDHPPDRRPGARRAAARPPCPPSPGGPTRWNRRL